MKKNSKRSLRNKKKFYINSSIKHPENFNNRFQQNIEDLKYYKPVGLTHLNHLAKILGRIIQVWFKERLIHTFGKNNGKPKINVEFKENESGCDNLKIGHFTLKGGREPLIGRTLPNDCLFNVISVQTGINSQQLRTLVNRCIRKKLNNHSFNKYFYNTDLRGGARYIGKNKSSAKRVLDASQNGFSHPNRESGHPRGHASGPRCQGPTECVENYSKLENNRGRNAMKTAFLSRDDQDMVAHLTLKTGEAQDVLELMSDQAINSHKEVIHITPEKLAIMEGELPDVQEFYDGEKVCCPGRIRKLVLVLKHFYEKYDDEDADPFVLTFYPML